MGMILLAVLLTSCKPSACETKDCFITAADQCQTVDLELTEDIGVVQYAAQDCTFTKTIVSSAPGESEDIRNLIEGKSLICDYEQGAFDERWVNSIYAGTGDCEGELREVIAQLIIFS